MESPAAMREATAIAQNARRDSKSTSNDEGTSDPGWSLDEFGARVRRASGRAVPSRKTSGCSLADSSSAGASRGGSCESSPKSVAPRTVERRVPSAIWTNRRVERRRSDGAATLQYLAARRAAGSASPLGLGGAARGGDGVLDVFGERRRKGSWGPRSARGQRKHSGQLLQRKVVPNDDFHSGTMNSSDASSITNSNYSFDLDSPTSPASPASPESPSSRSGAGAYGEDAGAPWRERKLSRDRACSLDMVNEERVHSLLTPVDRTPAQSRRRGRASRASIVLVNFGVR